MAIQQTLERVLGSGRRGERAMGPQHFGPRRQRSSAMGNRTVGRISRGLGWFSIGLGAAEIIMPRQLAKFIGAPTRTNLIRWACGAREIGAGVAILSQPMAARWLWARVAGDAADLALLGTAFGARHSDTGRLTAATAAVAGVTALDIYTGVRLTRGTGPMHVSKSIAVNRSPEDCYQYWRNFENLPRFMNYLESVRVTGDRRSHWRARVPGGITLEWDAETTQDQPNSLIAWRSLPYGDVDSSGTVRFERAPGGRGTLVGVEMQYNPPGGRMAANLAKLAGAEPGQQLEQALRQYKQILETGEIVRSDASIHTMPHAAQPPAEAPPPQEVAPNWGGGVRLEEMRPAY